MIKIALTNLGQYNEGMLNYKWVDLPATEEELQKAMEEIDIGKEDDFGQPYEEYFISDWESDIKGIKIGEYSNLESLNEMAEKIESLDEDELLALQAYLEDTLGDFDYSYEHAKSRSFEIYEDCKDTTDIAFKLIDEFGIFGRIPERLLPYVNYEAYGNDLSMDSTFYFFDKGGNNYAVELLD